MMPIASQMAHDTDARTGTCTGNKGHIIPLNNHLNVNATVSLVAPSALHDMKHAIAMYMPKVICPSNAT